MFSNRTVDVEFVQKTLYDFCIEIELEIIFIFLEIDFDIFLKYKIKK